MLARGGTLAIVAILLWGFATLGVDFFGDIQLPNLDPQSGSTEVANDSGATPSSSSNFPTGNSQSTISTPNVQRVSFQRTNDTISIGSFNIQVFGVSKMNKPDVVALLVDIARKFDVLAIQEVRSIDQNLIPYFVNLLNQNGSRYDYVLGPRQGRSNSKEQYVYVFDTTRIELISAGHIVHDPHDWMHREPLVSTFRTRVNNGYRPFSFKLMNVHTDPDEVPTELAALAQFITHESQLQPTRMT